MSTFRNISGHTLVVGYGMNLPKAVEDDATFVVVNEADAAYSFQTDKFEVVAVVTQTPPTSEESPSDAIKEQ